MLAALAVIVGLGMIVFFHELGHFWVSKAVGLPVERFSIGFPPFIFRKTKGETEYCLGSIPLGGYVKVNLGVGTEDVSPIAWWKRAMVVLAGPLMNLFLAGFLMFLVLGIVGTEIPVIDAVVGTTHMNGLETGDIVLEVSGTPINNWTELNQLVENQPVGEFLILRGSETLTVVYNLSPDSIPGFIPLLLTVVESSVGMPAYEAGIRSGDSIVSANHVPVIDFSELQKEVSQFEGQFLELVYMRNAQLDTAWIEPIIYEGRALIGVTSLGETETLRLPIGRAVVVSAVAAVDGAVAFFSSLIQMVARPAELIQMSGGPVFVAETLGQQAGFGLSRFLETIAYFSLAIMGFNLLPLPILDGGQFLFILFEGIRGKPASPKIVQIAQQVGVMLLLLLFAAVIFKDISRVVTRVR